MLSATGNEQTHLEWRLVRPKNAGSPQEPARKARQSAATKLGWQHLPAHGQARAQSAALSQVVVAGRAGADALRGHSADLLQV